MVCGYTKKIRIDLGLHFKKTCFKNLTNSDMTRDKNKENLRGNDRNWQEKRGENKVSVEDKLTVSH